MEENGRLICLRYKYNNDSSSFDTYEKALDIIKKYPIVFTVLPEKFKDKQMVLTFIQSNGDWIKKYKDIQLQKVSEQYELAKRNIYTASDRGSYNFINQNAVVDELIDLGKWTKDSEVLEAAMKADCYGIWYFSSVGKFDLNEGNYDETTLMRVAKSFPQIICRAYVYWENYIKKYPKVIQSVQRRYELFDEAEEDEIAASELALYKCMDLIEEDSEDALSLLYLSYYMLADSLPNIDNDGLLRCSFSKLSVDMQIQLASNFFYFVKFMKKKIITENLQKEIVENCPIAGDILCDEAILKYDLKQSVCDNQMLETCKSCMRCQFNRFIAK